MTRWQAKLVLAAFLWALPAAADLPAPLLPIPVGDDRIEPVMQGSSAPFTGQLFDNKTALRWGNYLEQCKARLSADVELQRKTDQAQIDYLKTVLAAEQQRYATVTVDYQKRLAEAQDAAQNPPFYKTTWFGVVVGVVGTIAAVSSTAYLVHTTR